MEQALSNTASFADHQTTTNLKARATRPRANQTQTATARPAERPPVPEPASVVAAPLDGATANGSGALVVAPVVPAGEHIDDSAADGEPIEITPEEKEALTALISRAAQAEGFKGRGYVPCPGGGVARRAQELGLGAKDLRETMGAICVSSPSTLDAP